jgi:SAM-dependent methyltransferase
MKSIGSSGKGNNDRVSDVPVDDLAARLERERLEADRLYNEALTALDRALVTAPVLPRAPVWSAPVASRLNASWDILSDGDPAKGSGLGGWVQSVVWRMIGPPLAAQKRFNAAVVEHLNLTLQADEARARTLADLVAALGSAFDGLVRFEARLMDYLRTITLYVDSKDRSLAGPELRDRLALAETRLMTLKREAARLSAALDGRPAGEAEVSQPPAPFAGRVDAGTYLRFEDRFRGSREEVRARAAEYLPLLEGAGGLGDIVDIGCGRGELLGLLRDRGIGARGVDTNHAMVEACRAQDLSVEEGDALAFLLNQGDESLGGLVAIQVVEHLAPAYLVTLLETAYHKLRPGAPLILETLNPACWLAFFETYLRDLTHEKALHPDTLRFLVQASGFSDVDVRFNRPVPETDRLDRVAETGRDSEWAALAAVLNAHADKLNARLFSSADYAIVARR